MHLKISINPKSGRVGQALTAASLLFLLQTATVSGATWYIAPNGNDSNAGSQGAPFATITKAQSSASSGDTVYLRGGTYFLNNSHLTATNNPYVIVNNITKSGISYLAYPGEKPVFDFTSVQPSGFRVTAFLVAANNCVFQGFEVVGVQVTIPVVHTQSESFRVAGGNNNRFEQLSMHDSMAIGWYLTSGANNLVLNCDAYNNWGLDGGSIGNTDGFGCHPTSTSGTNNVFRGCRAWFNSDDNYDCINSFAAATFDHCWAFYAGYYTNFTSTGGDANGFKGGGYGAAGGSVPNPVPRHVIQFCLSVRNRASGFYSNHHVGGSDWFNNTAYRNGVNYNMLSTLSDNLTDVPGYGHYMRNNLGYLPAGYSNLDTNNSDVSFNSFTLPVTVSASDFASLDESYLMAPRQANGELPEIPLLHLVNGSDLIDAGKAIASTIAISNPPVPMTFGTVYPFNGSAPDLGRFEYNAVNVPNFGFETPFTSTFVYNPGGGFWTFSGSAGNGSGISRNGTSMTSSNTVAPDAAQVAFLQGAASISQALSGFVPGTAYTVTFSAAQRNRAADLGQTWDLKVGNTVVASYAPPHSATNYATYSASFIATASTLTLSFVGTDLNGGDNTVFIDSVGVAQILALGLVWRGDGTADAWDASTANWYNGPTAVAFADGNNVAFDDTGSNAPPITLIGTLFPASVIVNAVQGYIIGGNGTLAGTATLGKAGAGTLTVSTTNTFSGSTIIGRGALLVNGSLDQSPVTVWGGGVIGGSGRLGGGLTLQSGGSVMPGSGANTAGTLTVTNGLTELGGATNVFDLSNNPNGANDLINAVGDLNPTGTNIIQINPLNGTLALGVYPLISYSGNFNGDLTNFALSGSPSSPLLYGKLTNASSVVSLVVSTDRASASLNWNGGAAGTNWDTATSLDWLNGTFADYFYAADNVTFSNTAGTNVNLVGVLSPGSVVVNAAAKYSFVGNGSIGGSGGLTKNNSGTLIIQTTNRYSGPTTINGGTILVNGSLDQSAVTVQNGGGIGGIGRLGAGVTVQSGGSVIPGDTNLVGTLTVSNGLTEAGGVINPFELSGDPNGNNDLINVVGNLNLSGVNTIQLTLLNGTLGAGIYPLINYSGTLIGGINNLTLSGGFGILTNPPGQIALISNGRPSASLFWSGGAAGTNWDLGVSSNWLNGAVADRFFTLDSVTFTNTAYTNVVLVGSLQPAGVIANATANYSLGGKGSIIGSIGLTQMNTGTLTIMATNTYTGVTAIQGGGILSVSNLANGGLASAIGAASSGAQNILMDNGRLRYTGPNVAIDRGVTLNAGGGALEISTVATIFTNNGVLTGGGGLTKLGGGSLRLTADNNFSGGLTASAGSVTLASVTGAGTGTLAFNGGIVVVDASGAPAVYNNPVNVAANSILIGGVANNNQALGGSWSGSATLTNHIVNGGTFSIEGDMSGFSGTLVEGSGSTLRFFPSSTGSSLATFNMGTSNAVMTTRAGGIMNLGALTGGTNTFLKGASTTAALTTYVIGGNNASTTYSGRITNGTAGAAAIVSLVKVGTGTFTLAGTNFYWGNTMISNGTLALGALSSISNTPQIYLANNAFLDVSALANGFILNLSSNQLLGGVGSVVGNFTAPSNTVISPGYAGDQIGTLAFSNNVTLKGATNYLDVSATGNDFIYVNGSLTLSGTNTVAVYYLADVPAGRYPLLHYKGARTGAATNLVLQFVSGSRSNAVIDLGVTNELALVVSGLAGTNVLWAGNGTSNPWDVKTTADWLRGGVAADFFYNLDTPLFDDTSANNLVNLQGPVMPGLVTVTANQDYVFSNAVAGSKISGAAALMKSGAGTLTLLTPNDYSGATVISGGTLQVGNGGTSGSLGTGPLTNNATLAFNRSDAISYGNTIIGTGSLAKRGTGILTLSQTETYTGITTIQGGTLALTNSGSISSSSTINVTTNTALTVIGRSDGTLTLASGQTLMGKGTVNGRLVIGSGATVATGASVGVLTNNGPVVLNSGGTNLCEVGNAVSGPGTGWDLLTVTAGIDVQATSANPFTIKLISLGASGTAEAVANFDKDSSYSWMIASTTDSVTNFDASKFNLDSSSFSNDLAGGYFFVDSGSLLVDFTNNHAPLAATATYMRPAGFTFKIAIADLLANWTSDPDGDPRVLSGFSTTSTNGVSVTSDGTYLYYNGTGTVADSFGYTVQDVRTNSPAVYRSGDTVRTATGMVLLPLTSSSDPTPNITGMLQNNDGSVTLNFAGIPGVTYWVQAATNLPTTNWVTLSTNVAGPNGLWQFTDLDAAIYPSRFYRSFTP